MEFIEGSFLITFIDKFLITKENFLAAFDCGFQIIESLSVREKVYLKKIKIHEFSCIGKII